MEQITSNEIQKIYVNNELPIEARKTGTYFFVKRLFDIASSLFAIIIFSPLLLIISIIIKITSPGSILFKDKRIGRGGKEILVYKFRTMYSDAETNINKYLSAEELKKWEKERKLNNDPRITKVGKFLRKTSLDELPQLFNIFAGHLSVVGPRPITAKEFSNYNEEQIRLLISIRPGLTGYWQVYGRSDVTFASGERQKMNMEYFKKRSLWFDFKIIMLTIPSVLKKKGAR